MFISTYPSGKYLRDIRVRNGRESIIYGSGRIGIFLFIHFSKSKDECKNSGLIIKKHSPVISGLNSPKTQSGPGGKTKRINGCAYIFTERHESGIPSQFDSFLFQLLGHRYTISRCGHKDINIFFLKFPDNLNGSLTVFACTYTCCKSRCSSINKFYTSLSYYHVSSRTQPDSICGDRPIDIFNGAYYSGGR